MFISDSRLSEIVTMVEKWSDKRVSTKMNYNPSWVIAVYNKMCEAV